jgi:hypothetical protein
MIYSRKLHKLLFSSQTELFILVLAPQPSKIHVLIQDTGFKTLLVNITIIHAVLVICCSCVPEKVG